MNLLCDYLGFVLYGYCVFNEDINPEINRALQRPLLQEISAPKFDTEFQWTHVNFTWPSETIYQYAIKDKFYIPENIAIAGIKLYKDKLYVAMPRIRSGTPVTLASVSRNTTTKTNPLLDPFPSWKMNTRGDCTALQSVQSMEITPDGFMWVIDGMRIFNNTDCPAKLVVLDLNRDGEQVFFYEFPDHIALQDGGFLNDIVIDESEDGNMAYITDHSSIDPGLVVYSEAKNTAWKLRDRTMFGEPAAAGFVVDNSVMNNLAPIDGIALSPKSSDEKFVYFCALVGFNLYGINTKILKDEELCKSGMWRKDVQFVGTKVSPSDGMMMDNLGNLYFTLLPLYGVGRWNIHAPFSSSEIVYQNTEEIVWPDSFGFDEDGYLYLLANNVNKFFDHSYPLKLSNKVLFRVLKFFTGTKSYMYKSSTK